MRQKSKRFTISLIFLFLILRIPTADFSNIYSQSDLYGRHPVHKDIVYKEVDTVSLTMDIIRPLLKGDHPTVVYIHGGNWDFGDKISQLEKYYSPIFRELLKNNIIIATVNYRLTGDDVHMPIPIIDVKDAVKYLKKSGEDFGINGEKLSIWGTSAGAHISQIAAFSGDTIFVGDLKFNEYSSRVNLVINCFGPVDMNLIFRTDFSGIEIFFAKIFRPNDYEKLLKISRHFSGIDYEEDRDELILFCDKYTTTNFISQSSPPVLSLQGLDDSTVEPLLARLLKSALDENSVPNVLREYEGVGHSFLEASKEDLIDISKLMVEMIYNYN